ncbi:MAG: DNA-directed RNA polymerase subunit D [Desulfurococcales archaeon ex4484_204]|nr:MAG: DNA-directed RNA polymerase subunit D [Desulfurococcales archaeon ex4484_204]
MVSMKGAIDIGVLELTKNRVKLLIKNAPLPLVNAVRRAALEEVPKMAVDYVVVRTNTSILHDEIVAHRLAMIPLKSEEAIRKYRPPEDCKDKDALYREGCYATLYLEYETGDNEVKTLYSEDLKPLDDPDVKPVSGKIPIVMLGPNQRIALEAKARLGRGREHIKWAPATVSILTYVPKINVDMSKCVNCGVCTTYCPTGALSVSEGKLVVEEDRCNLCRQCIRVCEYDAIRLSWYEDMYYLIVESDGSMSPETIVMEAIKEIIKKLDKLAETLKAEVPQEVKV